MMRRVTARWHISDSNQSTECIVIKGVSGKEILVLVVPSRSPEVTDLLGLELGVDLMGWAVKSGSRNLENG